jgi:SH3 domain-containing YSC84-like protein 1
VAAPRTRSLIPVVTTIYKTRAEVLLRCVLPVASYTGFMKMKTTSYTTAIMAGLLFASPTLAEDKRVERLRIGREVLEEFINMPEGIPRDLVNKAECVAVIPSAKKLALGVGATFGKGALLCRAETGRGAWGAPLMIRMEGGSYGLQIGGEAADLVLLIMNRKGVDKLLESKLTLGADASVAVGPEGRKAAASTDAQMRAEILTYSRSRGVFAGLSLEGSVIRSDNDTNERLYGSRVNPRALLLDGREPVPPAARPLVEFLQGVSPTRLSSR